MKQSIFLFYSHSFLIPRMFLPHIKTSFLAQPPPIGWAFFYNFLFLFTVNNEIYLIYQVGLR